MFEVNLKNYEILNGIIPKYYKKKFPYNIQKTMDLNLEFTHKNVDLVYIKDKKYFVPVKHIKKFTRGGIYGGSSASKKIQVFLL
jgi:hypothetical protein